MMRLIDADVLIAEICQDQCERKYCDCDSTCSLVALAVNAPTVDAVPVAHGYWDDSFDGITPFCSECHMSHRGFDRTPNYCPHCGAKMDGVKQDDH